MNIIPKICELLGVEIGEYFGIDNYCDNDGTPYEFFFDGDSLRLRDMSMWQCPEILAKLVMGKSEIKKRPFEPEDEEVYWCVQWVINKTNPSCIFIAKYRWCNSDDDNMFKYCGNCFRTEAEAEKHKYEIYEKLTGKKWKHENAY